MQLVEVFLKTIGIQGSEKPWWRPEADIFWESTQDGSLFVEPRDINVYIMCIIHHAYHALRAIFVD